jgi:uncharacterized membrane protein YidH (DUF202 family)
MVEVTVRLADGVGTSQSVRWYKGSSAASIQQSIATALDIPPGKMVMAREDVNGGAVVALSDAIPSGSNLVIEPWDESIASKSAKAGRTTQFRGQVLKFERVQAHLANERTWLAWVRTALSALSISFSMLTLADDATSTWLSVSLFVVGCFMVSNVLFTFVTGWLRYVRVKDVLMMEKSEMTENFGRFGLSHHARFLAVLLLTITAMYIAGANDIDRRRLLF